MDTKEVTFSSLIDKVWLPAAIRFGITISEFWNLNPKYMMIYQEEYVKEKENQMKMIDIQSYYDGLYMRLAIGSCFNKKTKYPKKPLSVEHDENKRLESMTDKEYFNHMRKMIGEMNKKIKG